MGFLLQALDRLLPDPPPRLVFEVGSATIAGVRRAGATVLARASRTLPAPANGSSDIGDRLGGALQELLPDLAPLPSPQAALLLPDDETRLAVFEFAKLPRGSQELRHAVEERFRNSLPFDLGAARIAFQAQEGTQPPSVLAAAAPGPLVHSCEDAFEQVGLLPQYVGLSSAAALNLVSGPDMALLAKLGERALTMAAVHGGSVRLVRRIAFPDGLPAQDSDAVREIAADLYPTLIYIAENLEQPVSKLLLCGFEETLALELEALSPELGCPVAPLLEAGADGQQEPAGLQGYLHG